MTAWPADQLAVIATADELLIAPQRTDAIARAPVSVRVIDRREKGGEAAGGGNRGIRRPAAGHQTGKVGNGRLLPHDRGGNRLPEQCRHIAR